MALASARQIDKIQGAYVRIAGQAVTLSATSTAITTALTTALSTAGAGGAAVVVQPSTGEGVGVVTTGANNRVEIFNSVSGAKFTVAGEEVYGRLTEAAGVYTLTYFIRPTGGTETAAPFPVATTVSLEFVYRFTFGLLPVDAGVSIGTRNVEQDPAASAAGSETFSELLTVTATNTVSALTKTPAPGTTMELYVNGLMYSPLGGTPDFTISGTTITWSAANAGFSILTGDRVIASYSSFS